MSAVETCRAGGWLGHPAGSGITAPARYPAGRRVAVLAHKTRVPRRRPGGELSTAIQDLVDDESVDNAYDLVLRDLQGELVRLRDLRGHPVILSFLRYIG